MIDGLVNDMRISLLGGDIKLFIQLVYYSITVIVISKLELTNLSTVPVSPISLYMVGGERELSEK
jgi:hypothetical protein